ncbi:MAG: NADPH:quinone reductase [candidate division Zixibacteria bacterium]|nr:NADPH:quinone reductase [candidate division Zixibacteria bacterium]
MKAIKVREFGGPEVMKLEDTADVVAGEGQVVVRVHAAGVNPVDTYIRTGTYAVKPNLPYTPGLDAAGVVESAGTGVTHVKPGDRVYIAGSISGSYAEKTLCNSGQVHPLPDNVSFAQGACVFVPYGTAYRGLFQRGGAKAGETVLIHGASGGVGTAGVQLARAAGLTVIGTGGTERGRALVKAQGAHHVVDHGDPDYLRQIMDLTEGRGVDMVLEMLANVNLAKDLTLLARGGRVVVVGNRGTIEINPRETMGRDACIMGMVLLNTPAAELASIHAGLYAGLENGSLRPVVGQEIPLAEAARAHIAVMEPGAYGKIVLIP